jgi:hypothetical protein
MQISSNALLEANLLLPGNLIDMSKKPNKAQGSENEARQEPTKEASHTVRMTRELKERYMTVFPNGQLSSFIHAYLESQIDRLEKEHRALLEFQASRHQKHEEA